MTPKVRDFYSTYLLYSTQGLGGMVLLLLLHNADPDMKTPNGQLPLHAAAGRSLGSEALQALLKRTSQPSAKNMDGKNCLHLAAERGNVE
jgi:hypothetical protein